MQISICHRSDCHQVAQCMAWLCWPLVHLGCWHANAGSKWLAAPIPCMASSSPTPFRRTGGTSGGSNFKVNFLRLSLTQATGTAETLSSTNLLDHDPFATSPKTRLFNDSVFKAVSRDGDLMKDRCIGTVRREECSQTLRQLCFLGRAEQTGRLYRLGIHE